MAESERVQARRSALATMKMELGCIDCGYDEHPEALDFDHTSGIKVTHVSNCRSIESALLEIHLGRCEVVCANCHRVRSASRRSSG